MDLRNLLIERILFAVTEEELDRRFQIGEEEIYNMSDLDLFELYEAVVVEAV